MGRILFALIMILFCSSTYGQSPWVEGKLIVKLRPEFSGIFEYELPAEISSASAGYPVIDYSPIFSNIEEVLVGEDLIYEFTYHREAPLQKIIRQLQRSNYFQYVEPRYKGKLAHTPNDPQLSKQTYLDAIGAKQAWDSTKGSANIIVGLLDAGVDTAHEDLAGKFWQNSADPINGIDDDNDGYTDNFKGWNFFHNTGEVQYFSASHGVLMSGCIAPQTNNSKGISGVGYNSMILPVIVTNNNDEVVYGYEGIKYAADKGCKVINCSWNIKFYSDFGADMVRYAHQKGALIVAATGNNAANDNNYPALYNEVLGVCGVDNNGFKVSNSNYGYNYQISAPGLQILSTDKRNTYVRSTGTSMSSALVSGAAALLWAKYPGLTNKELSAYLQASSESVYRNGQNDQYLGKLGTGMLHIGKAMQYDGRAYPQLVSALVEDPKNGAIESGDTLEVTLTLTNSLANSGNVNAFLISKNLYADVVASQSNWASIAKDAEVDNAGNPMRVAVKANAPENSHLDFAVMLTHGTDTFYSGIVITVNAAFQIINTGKVETALGNRGTTGWYEYPQKSGVGFKYNGGSQLLYESGLMLGSNRNGLKVVDRIRGQFDREQKDFETVVSLGKIQSSYAPYTLEGKFDDSTATTPLEVDVTQRAYAWPGISTRNNFVIYEYNIRSKNAQDILGLYVGFVADWDIEDLDKNRAEDDERRYLSYTYSTENKGPYCGVQLLSFNDQRKIYFIDHIVGGAGGIDITDNDVFSKQEKLLSMSSFRKEAGMQSGGNDVLQVISTGPLNIRDTNSITVKFAVMAAESLQELQETADTVFWIENERVPDYLDEESNSFDISTYPNPTSDVIKVSMSYEGQIVGFELIDLSGRTIQKSNNINRNEIEIDLTNNQPGTYLLRIDVGSITVVKRVLKN